MGYQWSLPLPFRSMPRFRSAIWCDRKSRFSQSWEAGAAIGPAIADEALALPTMFAAQSGSTNTDTHTAAGSSAGLSPREIEVPRLVVAGKSNRAIAADLFIGYRTVTSHVDAILGKLGVRSRAGAASEAVRLGFD